MSPTDLEPRIQTYGREIFARLDRQGPVLFSRPWWDDRMMGVTMENEALKVQLFRFVDTLPYLISDPAEIGRHLREYLGEASDELPWWVRAAVRFLPERGLGSRLLAAAAKSNATRTRCRGVPPDPSSRTIAATSAALPGSWSYLVDFMAMSSPNQCACSYASVWHPTLTSSAV